MHERTTYTQAEDIIEKLAHFPKTPPSALESVEARSRKLQLTCLTMMKWRRNCATYTTQIMTKRGTAYPVLPYGCDVTI